MGDELAGNQKQLTFEGLIAMSEAVVAVEILSTDYTRTALDGPMVATAKILKALKGPYATGEQFSFSESPWIGRPTYQHGERRILFLVNVRPSESSRTIWTIENREMRTDFFIEEDSVPALSEESLKSFLREIQESEDRTGRVVFDRRRTEQRFGLLQPRLDPECRAVSRRVESNLAVANTLVTRYFFRYFSM